MNPKMKEQVDRAFETVKQGGVILYPTDTVWGIGCDATNPDAVEKVYRLKQSGQKKSMLVLMSSVNDALRYTNGVPAVAWDMMEMATNPLTVILPGASGLARNLIPEEGTLGVRIPDDEFCQALLGRMRRPLVSTSANITGQPAPLRYEDIAPEIFEGVDMAVDPSCESRTATGKPSSLVKIGTGGEIEIIRE